ncbi:MULTISPECIES: hypothetical protein [Aurantimonas]|uniref:hypothetical protein n=1 Tax=Aurantimonas TaxID=182269 RepID=UPI003517EA40
MSNTPTLTLRYSNTFLIGLVTALQSETGWSDTAISRDASQPGGGKGGNPDLVRSIRLWDGARKAPTLRTTLMLEDHARTNLGEEAYQRITVSLMSDMLAPSIMTLAAVSGDDPRAILDEFYEKTLRAIALAEPETEAA